jgi:hypothetical protein
MLRHAVRILNGHTWSAIDNNDQIHKPHYTAKHRTVSGYLRGQKKIQGDYFINKTDKTVYLTSLNIFSGISVIQRKDVGTVE